MKISQYADIHVVTPEGRLDHSIAEEFEQQLMEVINKCCIDDSKVVMDMALVEYMSSVGLRVLMVAAKQCKQHGGEVIVCGLQPIMVEIFEISRFNKVFSVFESVENALTELSAESAKAYLSENS